MIIIFTRKDLSEQEKGIPAKDVSAYNFNTCSKDVINKASNIIFVDDNGTTYFLKVKFQTKFGDIQSKFSKLPVFQSIVKFFNHEKTI